MVSSFIERSGKSHTIVQNLVLPLGKAIVSAMTAEDAANSLNKIVLSNNTIKKRIANLSGYIKKP